MRESLEAWQVHVPRVQTTLGRARARLRTVGERSGRAADADRRGRRHVEAAGRRHAVVHDGVRARHADHVAADAAVRAGARARCAPRARRAAGDRGRRVARRRAGQDRPRGAARQGGDALVRPLLRHRRRDAAVPRPALRGLAVDGRHRARHELRGPALAALRWIDEYGDRDGDGFVEYERRTARGLENQSWKDSADSQRFRDGRIAAPPIAPCEVQGYVYDAKVRHRRDRARGLGRRRARRPARARGGGAARPLRRGVLDRRARRLLRARARRRQAAASTRSAPTSATCSGAASCSRTASTPSSSGCSGDELWSGWGIRTMSTADAAYNPLSYHNGTVWPHDNSLCAAGLARYERWPEAQQIVRSMLDAARTFGYQLPEVFAGLPRVETPFPIAYPTAARPQAWAAGTPVLLLQVLLGLRPDRRRRRIETVAPQDIPAWTGSIRLSGVRAFDRVWDVRLDDGRVKVKGGVKIAILSPGVVPRAADRLRRHRVDRLAARGRARRGGPRRDAVRVRRLAHEGEAVVHLRDRAERGDRPRADGGPARALRASSARTSST